MGHLTRDPGGAIGFRYDEGWLERPDALPVSLSLPLREEAWRGEAVTAVFDNLLPDSDDIRRRIAAQVGADGIDAYSMLASIGQDCVGALRFTFGDDHDVPDASPRGEAVDDEVIERMLRNLARAPLGLTRDSDFRISVAGAQEKIALLRHEDRWLKPFGTTPTTHILKPAIGIMPGGVDLSNSVENEYYCLKLAAAFGLPASGVSIMEFGATRALVVERFDRRWTGEGRLLRRPQEDCCQALSVPSGRKYESDGGPGMKRILELLSGSDIPARDQKNFLLAQMFFWIIGATDGHAKNFSLFLGRGGSYSMTPLYDVLTMQPSLAARQVDRRDMKLAMCAGDNRHYRIDEILPRHFVQTARAARVPLSVVSSAIGHVIQHAERAFDLVEQDLPAHFPPEIPESVRAAALPRIREFEFATGL